MLLTALALACLLAVSADAGTSLGLGLSVPQQRASSAVSPPVNFPAGMTDGIMFNESSGDLATLAGGTLTRFQAPPRTATYSVPATFGTAIGHSGVGSYPVFRGTSGAYLVDTQVSYTLALLVKMFPGAGGYAVLTSSLYSAAYGPPPLDRESYFYIATNYGAAASAYDDTSGVANDAISTRSAAYLSDGNWHLMVCGYNAATGKVFISIDNESLVTVTRTVNIAAVPDIIQLSIVASAADAYVYADYALFYNRALTGAEISALWNGGAFYLPTYP